MNTIYHATLAFLTFKACEYIWNRYVEPEKAYVR